MEPITINSLADVQVGMRAEAQDQYGKWYVAKVIEVDEDDKDVLVHFDGWSSRYDEYIDIEAGRLRVLSEEALRLAEQKRIKRKPLNVGDRVQAKWEDGKMYFGKILSIGNGEVDVLFDDGVEYTAPFSHVRRRRPDKATGEQRLKENSSVAAIDARRPRTRRRHHSEESSQGSQASLCTSPPSSPVFVPKKWRASGMLPGESATETESDPDDGHVRIGEKTFPGAGCHDAFSEQSTREVQSPLSSDAERPKSHKKVRYKGLRDPYRLRSGPIQPKVSAARDKSPSGSAQHGDSKEGDQLLSSQQLPEDSATPEVNSSADQGDKPEGKTSCSAVGSGVAIPGNAEGQSSDSVVTLLYCDELLPEKGGSSGFDTESSCSSPASCMAPPSPSGVACPEGIKFRKQSSLSLSNTTHPSSLPPLPPPPPSPLLLPHISASGPHQKKTAKVSLKTKEKTVGQGAFPSRPKAHGKVTSTLVTATVQALSDATLCRAPSDSLPSASGYGSVASEGTQTPLQTSKSSTRRSTPGTSASSAVGRSLSDSHVPSSPVHDQAGGLGAKRRSSANTSIVTRNRAQTIFEKMKTKERKQSATKVAPKELVILWDHNEFKCKFVGCTKSFRKESLLLSHMKHYHDVKPKSPVKGLTKTERDKSTPKSPKSPLSPKPARARRRLSLSSSPKSPKSPVLQSILTSPSQMRPSQTGLAGDGFRRSKSPTESFFETMERQQKSGEILSLLEQSTREQPMPATSTASAPKYVASTISQSQSAPSVKTPRQTLTRPAALQLQDARPKPPRGEISKQSRVSNKKHKLSTVQPERPLNLVNIPLKFPLVEIKALVRDSLPATPPTPKKSPLVLATSTPLTARPASHSVSGPEVIEELDIDQYDDFPSPSSMVESGEENSDDVVHCICGSTLDEGFMIQCEQCLCWQHGDCIGLTQESMPDKYLCCFCSNPPGQRSRLKYRFNRDWFEGTIPSLPGGPKFTEVAAVCKSHKMSDALYKLRKIVHSTKVKLQAASNPSHPYLRQWAKDCVHLSKEDLKAYAMAALQPISYQAATSEQTDPPVTDPRESSPVDTGGKRDLEITVDRQLEVDFDKESKAASVSQLDTAATNDKEDLEPSPTKRPRRTSSPVNTATLSLDPLPPPESNTPLLLPPPSSSAISMETTPDLKSLTLAPLPPLTSEDLHDLTSAILKSTLPPITSSTGTNTVSSREQSSSSLMAPEVATLSPQSAIKSQPLQLVAGDRLEKTSEAVSSSVTADTSGIKSLEPVVTDVELSEEFGVQEMAVFAVEKKTVSSAPTLNVDSPKSAQVDPSPCALQVPVPLSPAKLLSSSNSAFDPIVPSSATSPSSHLATLLADPSSQPPPATSSSSIQTPSTPSKAVTTSMNSESPAAPPREETSTPAGTRTSKPVSYQTTSSLEFGGGALESVSLERFVEAFMHAEGKNWCHRMMLLDHIDAVQEKVAAWLDSLQKQMQELPGNESELENMASVLQEVQSTVRQLSRIQQRVAAANS